MAVPKRKTTPSRRNQRRAHDALRGVALGEDKTTGELKRSHHMTKDGFYKGRQIVIPSSQLEADAPNAS